LKKHNKIILILIFFIGISLLLYPKIGQYINNEKQRKVLEKYKKTINVIDLEKQEEIYKEAEEYNEKIYKLQKEDKKYNLDDDYLETLKLDDTSIMGYIEIPKIDIKLPIYHGVDESTLQKGVGHVKETSLPIGSNNQNSMLLGHSGLPTSEIFTNLEKLELNDFFKISLLNKNIYYKIINIEVILPEELKDKVYIEENKDLVTLVTCTPYSINSHRLIITGERIDYEEVEKEENEIIYNNKTKRNTNYFLILLFLIVLIIFIIIKRGKYVKKD